MILPRLVATDLDGTLLRSDGTVSAYTRSVLAELDQRGVPVVFVTGRPLRWMSDLWDEVGHLGRAVVSNGAVLFDVGTREVLEVHGIAPDEGLLIAERIREAVPGSLFAIECLDGIRMEPGFVDVDRVPPGSPQGRLEEVWDVDAVKLLVRNDPGNPRAGNADFTRAFNEGVSVAVGDRATPTWSMPGLAEISAPGVTKAVALDGMCADLDITRDEVVAFGDMPNDLAMLTWAGSSYAMADGHAEVIAAADHRCGGHDDDGVARTLVTLFGLSAGQERR